jgi:hypothetical protein
MPVAAAALLSGRHGAGRRPAFVVEHVAPGGLRASSNAVAIALGPPIAGASSRAVVLTAPGVLVGGS